jgi:hypothetical protein
MAALVAAGSHLELATPRHSRDSTSHADWIARYITLRAGSVHPASAAERAAAEAAQSRGVRNRAIEAVENALTDSVDVRPVNIGEVDRRAILGHIVKSLEEAAADHLAPRQVSVGVSGGISILFHGLRLVMDVSRGFVVIRIDLKNAYNLANRAKTLGKVARVRKVMNRAFAPRRCKQLVTVHLGASEPKGWRRQRLGGGRCKYPESCTCISREGGSPASIVGGAPAAVARTAEVARAGWRSELDDASDGQGAGGRTLPLLLTVACLLGGW